MDGPFQWVYQTQKIFYHLKVTVKWNITLWFFSKKKEMKLKNMAMSFSNFLSKRATISIFSN